MPLSPALSPEYREEGVRDAASPLSPYRKLSPEHREEGVTDLPRRRGCGGEAGEALAAAFFGDVTPEGRDELGVP